MSTKTCGENIEAGKCMPLPENQPVFCTKAGGYLGFWHGQSPTGDEFAYKYSGGLATYPFQARPYAVFRPEVNKTFFCWGGTPPEHWKHQSLEAALGKQPCAWDFGPEQLLHMVSYYDHATGRVPRPTILFDKWCGDAHDNPVLNIDEEGYIYVFSPSHGDWTTRSFIHRSVDPYCVDRFETVHVGLFAYPNAWFVSGRGWVLLHTIYGEGANRNWGRHSCVKFSPDGSCWSESHMLASMAQGSYQVSAQRGQVVGTAFDFHPEKGGLDARTNLYYMESPDGGHSWQTADGTQLHPPLIDEKNPALVRDYRKEGLLVYIKNLAFDASGCPVIVFTTSPSAKPGEGGPRTWHTAHWTGAEWKIRDAMVSDNNYDRGAFSIETDGTWRLCAPTESGPQAGNPGGEMELWESNDQGVTWTRVLQLTKASKFNHGFARRPLDAHPDFSVFWADGHARRPSESRLYFSNFDGSCVMQFPEKMDEDLAVPTRL